MNTSLVRGSLFLLICTLNSISSVNVMGQTNPPRAVVTEDGLKVMIGNRVLLQHKPDGYIFVHKVTYSPTGRYFVVIVCGYECTDNIGFLFRADGSGKREFTGRWDYILQDKVEWSADGTKLYYYRIKSTGADPPKGAPAEGWVVVDAASGRKGFEASRHLQTGQLYTVFDVDDLVVRSAPGKSANEIGRLAQNTKGVTVTGPGKISGRSIWVPIRHKDLAGWVNQRYLFAEPKDDSPRLEAIAESEWVLRAWKANEPAPDTPRVTLKFTAGKFVGTSGCNRYSTAVVAGPMPGKIKVGPTISTRMACVEPGMSVESRFLKQIEAVNGFDVSSSRLALTFELNGVSDVMLFERKQP